MRAKEFIVEYRNRLFQYVKSLLPTWPDYVLKDWLVPNKGNFSNLSTDAVKNSIMKKVQGAGLTANSKWQLVLNMQFTMDMFEPMTKQRLIGRAGGSSDLGMGIPKDKERHATQAVLAQQQGGVRKEPVLLIKSSKGYELLEGWHRTIQHFVKYPDGYTGPAYVVVAQGQQAVAEEDLSEVDRRGALKALGAGAMAAAVPGVAQAGPFVDVAALGNTNPDQFNKVWVPRYKELTARCQDIMRRLIAAAGTQWASLLKGTTIRVVSSDNYAQASAISRMIAIDLSVFWDAPDAALAFTIAHELGHVALEHGASTDDDSADYKTQLRMAALYRQGELDADEFAVRICKVLGYSKAEVFKFIAKNEAELQLLDALTKSPTSTHPSQKTRIERARMNGFQLSKGGIQQMNVLKQHLAEQDEEEPARIKIGSRNEATKAWIEKVYTRYPHTFNNNHVMSWGEGDDQELAMFELEPSMIKRGAVEVKWFQAYPLRRGIGSRAMTELKDMAREDGISLTLFPWDKGRISQAKLMKFYRMAGFKPISKGGKSMSWSPEI